MALITLLLPEQLAGIFSTDQAVVREAAHCLRIAAFSQLFLGAEVVLESALGGAGSTLPPSAWQHGHYGIAHSCGRVGRDAIWYRGFVVDAGVDGRRTRCADGAVVGEWTMAAGGGVKHATQA